MPTTEENQQNEVFDFDYIFNKYKNWIWAKACLATPDHQLREDIVQNIFLKFAEAIDSFQYEGAAVNWLNTVTRTTIIDMARKENTYKSHIELVDEEIAEACKNVYSGEPLDDVVKKEIAEKLRRAIRELKPIHYNVIVLHYYEDLSVKEIAERLNVSQNTIYSRLKKAKKVLYKKIGKSISAYYTE